MRHDGESSIEMNDERLSRLLRDLPREAAPPGFTDAVLRRLSEPLPRRRAPRSLQAVAAVAVLVLGLVSGALVRDHLEKRQVRREALARLDVLESEKRALEAELRRLARDARPVIYLDTTAEYDVVLDLTRLARRAHPEPILTPTTQGERR